VRSRCGSCCCTRLVRLFPPPQSAIVYSCARRGGVDEARTCAIGYAAATTCFAVSDDGVTFKRVFFCFFVMTTIAEKCRQRDTRPRNDRSPAGRAHNNRMCFRVRRSACGASGGVFFFCTRRADLQKGNFRT